MFLSLIIGQIDDFWKIFMQFGGGGMSEMDQDVQDLELKQFSKLPSGWQRVVIAVVFVVILVGIVLLKQMISTEEDVRHDEDAL